MLCVAIVGETISQHYFEIFYILFSCRNITKNLWNGCRRRASTTRNITEEFVFRSATISHDSTKLCTNTIQPTNCTRTYCVNTPTTSIVRTAFRSNTYGFTSKFRFLIIFDNFVVTHPCLYT